jgi:hypothetical protein
VNAEVGDLTLSDIKKIHAQIQGHGVPEKREKDKANDTEKLKKRKEEEKKDEEEEAKGNELTFKKLHLKLSSKFIEKQKTTNRSLTLEGHVTFNGKSSAQALLQLNMNGLTISGGLADFKIPETKVTIEEARMLIFIGFKHDKKGQREEKAIDKPKSENKTEEKGNTSENTKAVAAGNTPKKGGKESPAGTGEADNKVQKSKKRETEFAVLGVVKIHEVRVSVGFYTARAKGKVKRDWLAFGSIESLTLPQLVPAIKGEAFDLRLDNIALIASSEDREVKNDKEDETTEGQDQGSEGGEGDGKVGNDKADGAVIERKKEEKKKKKKDADKDNEEPAHAGILEKVEAYKYPIRKGER